MFERDGLLPGEGTARLLAIGRRLRAEYAALEEPIPERLTALLAQLEKQEQRQAGHPRSSADEVRQHHRGHDWDVERVCPGARQR